MRLRPGWPLLIFIAALIAIPTFEIWLLVQVAHQIGFWLTLLILVAEAVLGGWLMRREGGRAWQALTATFSTGRVPSGELADAALVLVGGVLLILPGFATDLIGFLFLLPLTRPLARRLLAFFVARRITRLGGALGADYARSDGSTTTIIRGETVDFAEQPGDGPVVISGEVTEGPIPKRPTATDPTAPNQTAPNQTAPNNQPGPPPVH
jgi:UPF0716 protein FxsA